MFVRAYSLKRTVVQGGDAKVDLEKGAIGDHDIALTKEEDDDDKKSIREISRGDSNEGEVVQDDTATEHTHTGDTQEADKLEV